MTAPPRDLTEPAEARDTPAVIHLPDQRQPTKKVTSGSAKRRRRHLEQFRTDDAEHEALHARLTESGLSLGAYVMELAALDGSGQRPRRRRRSPADVAALTQALVGFSRRDNNLNQLAHAGNRLALVADEHSAARLADEVRDLRRAIDDLRQDFAVPVAALLAVLSDDREG
jgi:hypothetical protein